MAHYLGFYIKFQSYVIAIFTILGTISMFYIVVSDSDVRYPLEDLFDFRFLGSAAHVFGVIWFAMGVSLLYGIFKEDKLFVLPFSYASFAHMFLLIMRDIVMIWRNEQSKTLFMHPHPVAISLYLTLHGMLTMIALIELIDHKPLDTVAERQGRRRR